MPTFVIAPVPSVPSLAVRMTPPLLMDHGPLKVASLFVCSSKRRALLPTTESREEPTRLCMSRWSAFPLMMPACSTEGWFTRMGPVQTFELRFTVWPPPVREPPSSFTTVLFVRNCPAPAYMPSDAPAYTTAFVPRVKLAFSA